MIGSVHFSAGGEVLPTYVLDMVGNLIRCSAEGAADSLIPYAVELVTPADEVGAPRPWSITPEAVISRVKEVAKLVPGIESAYPHWTVPVTAQPFSAPVGTEEDEGTILQAIELLPEVDDEAATSLRQMLAVHGVYPLPVSGQFNADFHQACSGEICVGEVVKVADGWFSNMKVYRKALVRSA